MLNSTYFGKTIAQFGVDLKKELERNVANEHNFLQLCFFIANNKTIDYRNDLKISLYDKLALPLTTVVLVLIGVPLAVSMASAAVIPLALVVGAYSVTHVLHPKLFTSVIKSSLNCSSFVVK